jgi:tetratricopeptide (TPR) repeat protein
MRPRPTTAIRGQTSWLLILGAVLLAQTPALGRVSYRNRADRRARALYLAGDRHYASGEYEQALDAFKKAYRLSPRKLLLYNIANACERLGRLAETITHLERYAARIENDTVELQDVLSRIRKLRRQLPADEREQPASMPLHFDSPTPRAAPIAARPAPRSTPAIGMSVTPQEDTGRGRRIGGYTMLGVGAASLVTGVVCGALALHNRQEAEGHCADGICSDDAREPQDRFRTQAIVADVAFGVAAVSTAIGAYLVLTGRRRTASTERRPTVEAGISGQGVRVAVTHRF